MVHLQIYSILKSMKCDVVCHMYTKLTFFLPMTTTKKDTVVNTEGAKRQPFFFFLNKVLSTGEWYVDFSAMRTI